MSLVHTESLREETIPNLDEDLVFQVTDIADRDSRRNLSKDEQRDITETAKREGVSRYSVMEHENPRLYQILMSGVTPGGIPVTVTVGGFRPFFYIKVPGGDSRVPEMTSFIAAIRDGNFYGINTGPTHDEKTLPLRELVIRMKNRGLWTEDDDIDPETEDLIRTTIESGAERSPKQTINSQLRHIAWPPILTHRRDLYWYKGEDHTETYLRIECLTKAAMYSWKKVLLDGKSRSNRILRTKSSIPISLDLYEANLEPTLRFIHSTGIDACGWVTIPSGSWDIAETAKSYSGDSDSDEYPDSEPDDTTIIRAECDNYRAVTPTEGDDHGVAPVLTASFDIECDSSHGDFPLATKRWEREVLVMATTPGMTSAAATAALREAVYGHDADADKAAPFGAVYLKKPPRRGNAKYESLVNDWITEPLLTKVLDALKKKEGGKEHAQNILAKATPRWTGGIKGDPIIQIGTTFHRSGEIVARHIITLGTCEPSGVPGTEVVQATTEEEVLREWVQLIQDTDPDIITGYNITFFDMGYIQERADVLGVAEELINSTMLSRYPGVRARYRESRLSSAAMGDNFLKTIEMPGRVVLDLCAAVRRNFASLSSYKLDSVAQEFLFGKVLGTTKGERAGTVVLLTDDVYGLVKGGYLHACDFEGEDIGGKLKITNIRAATDEDHVAVGSKVSGAKHAIVVDVFGGGGNDEDMEDVRVKTRRWTQAKDDVPPSEIFRLQKGSADDRAIVAKYCVQDCDLVLRLLQKLDLTPNGMAMGTVCSVPLSYIFTRGQTIKSASLLFRECEKAGLIVPVLPAPTYAEMNDSYEGAVVLEPKTGLYLEEPVAVLDYSSLYPSSMISENISHDSIVAIWDKDNDGRGVRVRGDPTLAKSLKEGDFVDITFDRFEPDPEDKRKHPVKVKVGTRTCRFVQFDGKKKGIIGTILRHLLGKRKETKKRMKAEKDPFKKGLLNSLQLAYKVTANSLYGSLGAKNCKIRFQDLAASTTAYGRKLLNYAREGLERTYGRGARPDCDAQYVYGDTDSVFVKFCPKNPDGTPMRGRDALVKTIELAKEAEVALSGPLRDPHFLEYEKTFYPFMLFSKKRYIGMKYEEDPDKCKQANMGVVLKRRDNAPIVKEVYQAVVDTILKDRDLEKSITVAKDILRRLVAGEYGLKKLTVTKSLRAHYANPESIAHKVLAERIGERDPGNKPKPNDRIAYIYFDATKTRDSKKQGDRIETPEFIVANKLAPDYKHYITNQIQKPLTQLFALFWSQVPQSSPSVSLKNINLMRMRAKQDPTITIEKMERTIERKIMNDVERIVFDDSIRKSVSKRVGPMDMFIKQMNRRGGI
jgi:DNA polymerase elongation subunit (family B)